MTAQIVFLCARGSSRSILAASLLAAHAGERWEAWGTPTLDEQGRLLAEQVLRELSYTPPVSSPWDPVQMSAQAWVQQQQGK